MAGERDLGIGGIGDADPIGRGGNAVVYRARELDHDRWVAVKVLLGLGGDSELRRFDRERRAMGRLSEHDGIVPIYSSGITESGDPYLVMPLLPESLQDHLDDAGPNDWRVAAGLMVRVARTVEAAHQSDVIHRDLKPSNILLTSGGAPLVADFGIAQFADSTASTAITLTPAYSPPEVFDGAAPSEGADIYGLGATLFALIAGAPPFDSQEGENLFATMQRIANQPVNELRPVGVPDPVWAVVERAMRKTPDERYRTADEFATALEQAVEESGFDATPTKIVEDRPQSSDATRLDGAKTETVAYQRASSGSRIREPRVERLGNKTVLHPSPIDEEPSTGHEIRPPVRGRLQWAFAVVVVVGAVIAAVAVLSTRDADTGISVGESPITPVEANDLIWVPNQFRNSVSVIDATTRTVVDTITVESSPQTPIAANDLIWVPNEVSGSVSVIDATTRTVIDTIDIGSSPQTPIAANGFIWVPIGGSVSVIDATTRTVVDTIEVESSPQTPIAANDLIWVTNQNSDSVSVIDATTRTVVDVIAVGSTPQTPIAYNGLIWVSNKNGGSLSVIDAETRTVVDTVDVGFVPETPIAADDLIWVPSGTGRIGSQDSVTVIDAETREFVDTIEVESSPQTPIAANDLIWVTNQNSDSVSVIDATTRTVVDIIDVGDYPQTPIASNGTIWVSNRGSNSVSAIDETLGSES